MKPDFEKGASHVWYPVSTEDLSIGEEEVNEVEEESFPSDEPKGPFLNWL